MSKHVNYLSAILIASLLSPTLTFAEDKDEGKGKANVVTEQRKTGSSTVEVAVALIMKAEAQKAPLLLLAAADLLDSTTESDRKTSDLKSETEDGPDAKSSDKSLPEFSREALEARALELAANEADKKLVQEWIARPASRGLILSQGKNLDDFRYGGERHKVLHRGVIGSGDQFTITNAIFEAGRLARVVVIGDGDGDLDLWVYDGDSGALIDKDTDRSSLCEVVWRPRYQGPFTIKVKNVGAIAERYVVLANW
ncbi:hypothetical protein [Fuerstiella marisgermanici]|uniref:Uncharacterized protein n=1 Tax=Fuerstiella marisgermanici TaxID=1891926 RepID=A0A1P8WGR1_9PLAN|nr:hypothetical protein [Fuerstiella marisgermanici]APZ93235.1 hypothetical protein Fuma_02852 [Fuerstiella marisgermanici]